MRELGKTVGDPSANKEGAEVSDQKPFVIRGHHLGQFACFVRDRNAITPQFLAKSFRIAMEMIRYPAPSPFYTPGMLNRNIEYSQDVIGTTMESADRYEKSTRKIFERFMSLPDNHPAEIVEEIPDVLCEACMVGQHCRQVTVPFKKGRDGECIDRFLWKIELLNLPEPVITNEQLHFADSEPEQARRVKTTLGTVKKVLKEESPYW